MNKIALFYSFNTRNTSQAAELIAKELGEENVDKINVEEIEDDQFLAYPYMILGASTWFDGELPNYWDEFVPAIEDMDLKGKKVAIFGHGDQVNYPQNFVDAIGIMAELMESGGAKIIGEHPLKGYTFESSRAVRDGKFLGLVLDNVNQADQTEKRIKEWVGKIRKHFK
jgi:flavodoxin I